MALTGALVFGALSPPPALAASITVTTTADEYGAGGGCSLREAIKAANDNTAFGGCSSGSGADLITVPPGTYGLTIAGDDNTNAGGDLDIRDHTTIQGGGTSTTVVNGNGIDRVFEVDPALTGIMAAITDLTVRGGDDIGGDVGGGGIFNHTTLTLARVAVVDNEAEYAGGIANWPGSPSLTMTDSLIANNRTADEPTNGVGGGLTLENSASASLTNVTISGNTAENEGGGIWHYSSSSLVLNNVTITGNTADSLPGAADGGGIQVEAGSGPVTVRNSIVFGNTDASGGTAPDCDGAITSGGHNLIGTTAGCTFTSSTGDITGQDPKLGPLADNGGPTQTHALLASSPAIDAGNPAAPGSGGEACAATDQRGVPRNCDMGAYEVATCKGVTVNRVGTEGSDTLKGTSGEDGFLAGGGNDTASGGGGNDGMCGGGGNDKLKGQGGNDKLLGQGGKDLLAGGPGTKDVCTGGPGKDKAKGTCEKGRA
jgi:CSLREA domain-containing protein